jgi:pyruvate,orthophosphate dikinase
MAHKYVYWFGPNEAEGNAEMRDLLGGKGANLAEMARIGLPVPAGFTITTEYCNRFFQMGGKFDEELRTQVAEALARTEKAMGAKFGDPEKPLLVSCRSGARRSMPGMMETVLNVGLCSRTIPGMIASVLKGRENDPAARSQAERFVYDAYRRLIMMYSDVVMEKAEGIEPAEGQGIRQQLERLMDSLKAAKGYKSDLDLTAEDLKVLCEQFKQKVKEVLGREFPDDPQEQLWGAIAAVFKSWNGKRAVAYRRIEGIPDDWGTACNVQSMVFGNKGSTSGTGVAFTRNPATGENVFYGEWLPNAQGEDVVAGIRTPCPLNEASKSEQNRHLPTLEQEFPEIYAQLERVREILERHYGDMQDIEFTIEEGKLYVLQCRAGKRTGTAALNIALDMLAEGLIDERTAVRRVEPAQLDELLHPIVDPAHEQHHKPIARGLPAGPGAACGKIVFTSEDAVRWAQQKEKVILVREETSPEDVEGMRAAVGILTSRGGMTCHAALVARGWGKCCIVGAAALEVDPIAKQLKVDGKVYREGDILTLNGTRGYVYEGSLPLIEGGENPRLQEFLKIVDKYRRMGVRTNADTPADAALARKFGAEGIGLFRIEHMFYGAGSERPLFILRKVIHARTEEERRQAIDELAPYMERDIQATLEVMDGLPVTVRLLDPPLHEFVPKGESAQAELAKALGISLEEVQRRGEALHEANPMMGHRGVRLGISYPYLTEMQIRALLRAAANLKKQGKNPMPELMVPVTCTVKELDFVRPIFDRVKKEVEAEFGVSIDCPYGTMIEIPRAALLGDQMARSAEFFSFGTNDLTQMCYGFSRDDVGSFLPTYLEKRILDFDPFQTIDVEGVGQLMKVAVERGRSVRPNLKVGICGEQGGDPASVAFCYKLKLNYVSCSPYRVPVARLAAAHAAIAAGDA